MLFGAALVCACNRPVEHGKPKTAVRIEELSPAVAGANARYSGTVRAGTQVELAFKMGGYIHALGTIEPPEGVDPGRSRGRSQARRTRPLQVGDPVNKNMLLASLRATDFKQKFSELAGMNAEASAGYRKARADLDRAKKLYDDGAISRAEYDASKARFDALSGSASAAAARTSQANHALSDSQLRAPLDGIVLERRAEVGALVAPGAAVFVVADTSTVKVAFSVPDNVQRTLAPRQELTVTTDAIPDRVFAASVTSIAAQADPKTRVFEVEASVDNRDGALKVGMVTTIQLARARSAAPMLAVPLSAVVRAPQHDAPDGFGVYVVIAGPNGPVASARSVELGKLVGNRVEVHHGVAAGDRVVVQGATLLAEGAAVNVVPTPSPVVLAGRM